MAYVLLPPQWKWVSVNRIDPETSLIVTTREWRPSLRRERVWKDDNLYYNHLNEVSDMKRKASKEQAVKGKYQQHSEPMLKVYPNITKYMWDCWYDDGSPRELGKLAFGLVPSGVSVSLTDPGERASAFTTAETLVEALNLLEAALSGPGDPWRPWPKSFGKK